MDVTVESRLGRHASRKEMLIGVAPKDVARTHGVRLFGKTVAADGNEVRMASGERVAVSSVIWATGFRPDYGWLRVPVLDGAGKPLHLRGVTEAPGLAARRTVWKDCLRRPPARSA